MGGRPNAASHRANVVVNLRRAGGEVEVVGDRTLRGGAAEGRGGHGRNGPLLAFQHGDRHVRLMRQDGAPPATRAEGADGGERQ